MKRNCWQEADALDQRDPRLHRLLHRLRSFQCALADQNFLASRPKLIKTFGYLKHDFLMSPVEANVCHHQLLSGRRDDSASLSEIEQQPFRAQFTPINL